MTSWSIMGTSHSGERKKQNAEYERFDATMGKLMSIPHSVIKAKLDAEKRAKANKPKRSIHKRKR
jgi:hypothetical protein